MKRKKTRQKAKKQKWKTETREKLDKFLFTMWCPTWFTSVASKKRWRASNHRHHRHLKTMSMKGENDKPTVSDGIKISRLFSSFEAEVPRPRLLPTFIFNFFSLTSFSIAFDFAVLGAPFITLSSFLSAIFFRHFSPWYFYFILGNRKRWGNRDQV